MKFSLSSFAPTAMLATAGMLVSGLPAHAAFAIFLSDSSCSPACPVTITDNGPGDTAPAAGAISANPSVGSFTTNLVSASSKPILTPANISGTSITLSSSGAGTLTFEITDTGFVTGGTNGLVQQLSITNLQAVNGVTVTGQGYEDNTNTQFGLSGSKTGVLSLTALGALQNSVGIAATTPFSLTEVVTVKFGNGGGSVNLTANLGTVPEPTSVALLGGVLLLTGTALRRKFRKI